jgi:hypothetical protein
MRCIFMTLAALATGIPLLSAPATLPCLGTQPLSGLIALASTGCTVTDKLFSNFFLDTEGTVDLDASLINVLTSTTPQGNHVLEFVGDFGVNAGVLPGTLTALIGYTVQTVSGAALIEDLSISVGPLFELGTGPNSVSATEYVCIGVNVGCDSSNANFLLNADFLLAYHLVFPPVNSLSVSKRLTITAEALNVVRVESLTYEISQVPEPGTGVLLGGGLVLAALGRMKRAQKLQS